MAGRWSLKPTMWVQLPPLCIAQLARYVAAGLCVASLGSVTLAIGLIFASLLISTSRAPWFAGSLTSQAFLGFALCEAMGLVVLLITVLILFV
jgi:F0F1-type ATP synthase membrane subunit c/vacuolar-type H+-ATPase subunit K